METSAYEKELKRFYKLLKKHAKLADIRVREDAWTLKEMLGHLVDSASNNHQRFIRLQETKNLDFPAYDAETWKNLSRIADYDYRKLLALWKEYNDFLIYLIKGLGQENLDNAWNNKGALLSLDFLVNDYFRHLDTHRDLFLQRVAEIKKASRQKP